VFQRQHCLDDTCEASCAFGMANVGFDLVVIVSNTYLISGLDGMDPGSLGGVRTAPINMPPWGPQMRATALASRGSPVGVPVPWHSKKAVSDRSLIPEFLYTCRINFSCMTSLGVMIP
jgi:hypothetical protein